MESLPQLFTSTLAPSCTCLPKRCPISKLQKVAIGSSFGGSRSTVEPCSLRLATAPRGATDLAQLLLKAAAAAAPSSKGDSAVASARASCQNAAVFATRLLCDVTKEYFHTAHLGEARVFIFRDILFCQLFQSTATD